MPTYKNKYKIINPPLGTGGAAKVYGCIRISDGERLAIKILSDTNNKDKVERFKREIDVIIDIVWHGFDGVLPILDYDKDDLWYVMPLANSLRNIIKKYVKLQQTAHPVTTYCDDILRQNVDGFIMLANTLEKIHELGYVHRDIKPDNLYVWNGRYCIGDFGIVDLPTNTALTKKHDRLGAWNTIAPEVLRDARNATNKSDVYSLAKSLWMCLTLRVEGFDGRYDFNAPSMSLHDVQHLSNAYLLDIDEILSDATQEDSTLRPSMKEFAARLLEWGNIAKDFEKRNKKEWGFIYKALFSNIALPIIPTCETKEIVRILHYFARYTHLNYTIMPQRGGLTLNDASLASEKGCIYLDFGSKFVCSPKQLVIRGFSDDDSWNYVFLELEDLNPILTNGVVEEELVEDVPGHYVDATCAVYGVYDYDSGKKFPDGWKEVTRICKGNFLIVSKGGFYNSITPVDDGRQSDFSETEFFDYITAIKNDVDNAKTNGTDLSSVRQKYWENPKRNSCNSKVYKNTTSSDYDIREHLDELSFADLLDDTGEGYAKYYFTFDNLIFRSPFDFFKDTYLCKDGRIKKSDINDDCIFYAYDKEKALLLLAQLNQRIAEECKKHGVADDKHQTWVTVHCMMYKIPTHVFTYKELDNAIIAADDRKANVVCIDEEGYIVVVSGDRNYHIYPVSYEQFGAFKKYVGRYSNGTAANIVKDLRSLFLHYIETGFEARYSEDCDNRDVKEILRETEILLKEYREGAKALPIKKLICKTTD